MPQVTSRATSCTRHGAKPCKARRSTLRCAAFRTRSFISCVGQHRQCRHLTWEWCKRLLGMYSFFVPIGPEDLHAAFLVMTSDFQGPDDMRTRQPSQSDKAMVGPNIISTHIFPESCYVSKAEMLTTGVQPKSRACSCLRIANVDVPWVCLGTQDAGCTVQSGVNAANAKARSAAFEARGSLF